MLAFRLLSLAPRPVRRKLVRALPHRPRRWVIRQFTRLRLSQIPLRPHPWAPPGQASGEGTTRVRDGRDTLVATVASATSPVQARRRNLTEVMAALDAAGVPYFRVPHASEQRTTLAVPADHRERTLTALSGPAMSRATLRGWAGGLRPRRVDVRNASIVETFWPVIDPGRTMLIGGSVACDIEFWTTHGEALVTPRDPQITPLVRRDSPVVEAADRDFDQFCAGLDDGARFPTRRELMLAGMDWVRFPVDAVYTWVDGSDPAWQRRKEAALAANGWAAANPQTANASRFLSRDELRYSLRSLHYYAPWIRRVFIVTDAQVPAWLDADHPQITVVDHREIFGEVGRLPTFNSHAIETRLHHIPGLAEHFLYLNDDVFFGRPQTPDQYFLPNGIAKFFPSNVPVSAGPPQPDDPPVMCAGKNNRDVVAERFGRLLTRKMRHTPHPQRRSVLAEIEHRCADLVEATASHQFRHPDDISVPSSLQHYWAYLTGSAVPGQLGYMYTDLNDPVTPFRLLSLLRRRDLDVFCLNDTDLDEGTGATHAAMLADLLPAYFPFAGPFELASAGARTPPPMARERPHDAPSAHPKQPPEPRSAPAGAPVA